MPDTLPRPKYFTPTQVSQHNTKEDCWVSWNHNVYDLTPLLETHENASKELIEPILRNAGSDISAWFTKDGDIIQHNDPLTNTRTYYTPEGTFLGIPQCAPVTESIPEQWWLPENAKQFLIGKLTERARKIQIINTLTHEGHILEVPSEELVSEIQIRYLSQFNSHAKGYMWKRLGSLLEMNATLDQNGIPDESEKFREVNDNEEDWYPVVHLYFSDDLTIA